MESEYIKQSICKKYQMFINKSLSGEVYMKEYELIKAGGLEDSTKLFRYLKLSQFVEFIEKRQAYFTNIKCWEDTWEAPTSQLPSEKLNEEYEGNDQNLYLERMIGQCWSLEGVSDALWRIYSTEKEGILIQTTAERFRLIKGIKLAMLAPVVYYGDLRKAIYQLKNMKYYDGIFGEGFLKRKAFEHEKEVRIITVNDEKFISKRHNSMVHVEFDLDPKSFIESIIIDPRSSDWYVETIKSYCQRAGLDVEPIKSDLYSLDIYESTGIIKMV